MTELKNRGNSVHYESYDAIPSMQVVEVPEDELRSTANQTGIVSIDDWLRDNDVRHRETVVPGNGGFRYPRMNLSDEDRLSLSGGIEAVRKAFLDADPDQLQEIRDEIDLSVAGDQ